MIEIRETQVFSAWLLLVILLAGGAKPTQDKDIKTALKLARNL